MLATSFSSQSSTAVRTGELYLHLQLGVDCRALLPMTVAQEVLIVAPQHFTLLPNQPAWVLGLFNYRNRILWGVDLGQFLGLEPLDVGQPEYHLVVMRPECGGLGLAVQQVRGVARVVSQQIQPLAEAQPVQDRFRLDSLCDCCSGLVWEKEKEETLWVLSPLAILQRLNSAYSQANP